MSSVIRSLACGGAMLSMAMLSACDSTSHASTSGASSVPVNGTTSDGGGSSTTGGYGGSGTVLKGPHNSIVATPASNLVSVQVGMKQTVPVTFTSSDGKTISGFGLTNTTLPAGWSGPPSFGCQSVSTGSGCVLNLTYTPAAYETGKSVVLNYIYVDAAGTPVTNAMSGANISMSFSYQGTTDDNVTNTVAPAGQINATIGSGQQSVTVTFATDDGNPAATLAIAPASLPAGWTAPSPASCASVSAGTACALTWVYQPLAPDSGTLTVDYSYNDDSGTAKSASLNIPYAATANNSVAATATPNALAVASLASPSTVTVTFVTDDTFPASGLNIVEDLSTLGGAWSPGWLPTSPSFTCATVDGTSTCALALSYGPITPGSGTLQLHYNYINNAGVPKTGSFSIAYAAT